MTTTFFPSSPAAPHAPAAAVASPPGFDVGALYRHARRLHGAGGLVTVLHLGDEHTLIATGTEATLPAIELSLAMGRLKTARDFFRDELPTPLELETAIAQVEDEVYAAHVRHRILVPQGALVETCATDPALHDIATLAGAAPGAQRVLTLDAMERLFNRLAAVSQGRPAAHEGLPASASFAAALLVLRELMHHLPFKTLTLLQAADVANVAVKS